MPRPSKPRAGQSILPGMVAHAPRLSRTPGYRRRSPEADEQAALIRWARLWGNHGTHPVPGLGLLFAVPNGGYYLSPGAAGKLAAAGLLPGVWDMFLPVSAPCLCGLWLEMKSARGVLSPEQRGFRESVGDKYGWALCRTWHFAAAVILGYLGCPRSHPAWSGLEDTDGN